MALDDPFANMFLNPKDKERIKNLQYEKMMGSVEQDLKNRVSKGFDSLNEEEANQFLKDLTG